MCSSDLPGRVRSANEDAVRFDAGLGLAILADGMGGYAAGEVASRMAVDEVFGELASALPHLHAAPASDDREGLHEDMRFAARRANTNIIAAARREPDYEGMGSTLVIAVLMHGTMTVAHLGDSRCYRYRAGALEQLTRDHCWVDEQIAIGALSVDAILASSSMSVRPSEHSRKTSPTWASWSCTSRSMSSSMPSARVTMLR